MNRSVLQGCSEGLKERWVRKTVKKGTFELCIERLGHRMGESRRHSRNCFLELLELSLGSMNQHSQVLSRKEEEGVKIDSHISGLVDRVDGNGFHWDLGIQEKKQFKEMLKWVLNMLRIKCL